MKPNERNECLCQKPTGCQECSSSPHGGGGSESGGDGRVLSNPETHLALLVEEVQDPQLSLDEIDTRLVVREVDESPGNLLLHILVLLQFEHMLRPKMIKHTHTHVSNCTGQAMNNVTLIRREEMRPVINVTELNCC